MVAREENITRAADLLHVTQPTLSRQLMQLERELGVKLFHRGQHSITLTDDGMLLKRRAQELVDLADKTAQEFNREEGVLSGEISIGCGETRNMEYLSQWIVSFQQRHPMVQFDIYSAMADDIKDRLEKGLLDLGLLIEPVDILKYDFLRFPLKEQWCILVRKDSPLAEKTVVTPEELVHVPLLMSRRGTIISELSNWFGDTFDRIHITGTFNLLYNASMLVENGAGAALTLNIGQTYQDLCFIPLSPRLESGCVLVWKKHQASSPAATAFVSHVKQCIKSISTH